MCSAPNEKRLCLCMQRGVAGRGVEAGRGGGARRGGEGQGE